jgi:hypothetical protein
MSDEMSETETDPRLDPARLRTDIDAQLKLTHAVMKQMDALSVYVDALHAYVSTVAHARGWPEPPQPGGAPRRGDLQ